VCVFAIGVVSGEAQEQAEEQSRRRKQAHPQSSDWERCEMAKRRKILEELANNSEGDGEEEEDDWEKPVGEGELQRECEEPPVEVHPSEEPEEEEAVSSGQTVGK